MTLCNEDCIPCCDFCIHVIYDKDEETGEKYGPIDCSLHRDKKHQAIAESCSYCEDFHCFRAK